MADRRAGRRGGGRVLLLAVAGLLSAAAALAIGILLFGRFGPTEGRILGTIVLLGGYGLASLPAALLHDRRRLPALAAAVAALALAAAAVGAVGIWTQGSDRFARLVVTANAWLAVVVVVAALAARRSARDPSVVRRLLVATTALAGVVATLLTTLVWAGIEREGYLRALGVLVVLVALLAALQPILARARPAGPAHRLRVTTTAGTVELTVEARDLAEAAAKAIRLVELDGCAVLRLELAPPAPAHAGKRPDAGRVVARL